MRKLRILGLLVVVAGLLPSAPGPAGAQEAASITESGWWTRRPGAAAAPAGGFEVSEAPDDDLSLSALRVRSSGTLTRATLILIESGGVRQADAALRVCVTTSPWTSANPGTWDKRPIPTCAGGGVAMARDATRTSWTANVLPLLASGSATTSLMVVPGPNTAGLPADGFQVTFAAAGIDAEAASNDEEDESASGGGGFGSGTTGTTAPPSFSFGFGGDVDTAPSFVPEPTAGEAITGPPTDAPIESTEDESAGSPLNSRPLANDGGGGQPWGRLPGLLFLALLLGAAAGGGRWIARERGLLSR